MNSEAVAQLVTLVALWTCVYVGLGWIVGYVRNLIRCDDYRDAYIPDPARVAELEHDRPDMRDLDRITFDPPPASRTLQQRLDDWRANNPLSERT